MIKEYIRKEELLKFINDELNHLYNSVNIQDISTTRYIEGLKDAYKHILENIGEFDKETW